MLEIDYEAWAKEAVEGIVDPEIQELAEGIARLAARLAIAELQGQPTGHARAAVEAAIGNLASATQIASAREAEELALKIVDAVGGVLVSLGKKALGFPA